MITQNVWEFVLFTKVSYIQCHDHATNHPAFSDALIVMHMGRICFGSKLVHVLLFCVIVSHTVSDDNVPVMVSRRLTDIYQYHNVSSTSHFSCDEVNATFLVSDRRCIKNQELFNGKYCV